MRGLTSTLNVVLGQPVEQRASNTADCANQIGEEGGEEDEVDSQEDQQGDEPVLSLAEMERDLGSGQVVRPSDSPGRLTGCIAPIPDQVDQCGQYAHREPHRQQDGGMAKEA